MVLDSLGSKGLELVSLDPGCGFPTVVYRPRPCALSYGTPELVIPTCSTKALWLNIDFHMPGLDFYPSTAVYYYKLRETEKTGTQSAR
jgi:hypothetical protein